jgi:Leucine-rich repeat (LRR) protein
MDTTPLINLLTTWDDKSAFFAEEPEGPPSQDRLITQVAFDLMQAPPEASLRDHLVTLESANPNLEEKIKKFMAILAIAHDRDRESIETELGLGGWHQGTDPDLVKERIVNCYLTKSKSLDLSGLRFNTLPDCIKDLSITFLNCSDNELTSLATLPSTLEQLFCYNNKLPSLPILPESLILLDCSSNQLTSPPTTLPSGLSYFDCNYNQLTHLPETLPTTLTHLACNYNQLITLPPLPIGLNVLGCSNNYLTELDLPDPLSTSLTEFSCDGNELPDSVVSLQR